MSEIEDRIVNSVAGSDQPVSDEDIAHDTGYDIEVVRRALSVLGHDRLNVKPRMLNGVKVYPSVWIDEISEK